MSDGKRLKGLDAWAHSIGGHYQRRSHIQSRLKARAEAVQGFIESFDQLADRAYDHQLVRLKEAIRRDPVNAKGQLEQVLAVVCIQAHRTLGLRPYLVQIMGALAIHQGFLAELATGEGKTLTVGLSAVLTGWTGKPCHVLTANDYLATRDAEEIEPLYRACSLHVSTCLESQSPEERKQGYQSDIVYVTPKMLLADYLRDVLAKRDPAADDSMLCLPRGLHTGIVDEADSMLIDESVTPLIVSAPKEIPGLHQAVIWAHTFTRTLSEDRDYHVDHDRQQITLEPHVETSIAHRRSELPPHWRSHERVTDVVNQALKVREFFEAGVQYLVQDDEVVLIDEFTGRLTPERSLSNGLHQAIEAKEGVSLTNPNFPLVQMTFQNFFRQFKKLACTTGTAKEAAAEFWSIYETPVIAIPTNRPRQVREYPVQTFLDREDKLNAIITTARELRQQGAPVLIGVRSVADSDRLSQLMLEHQIDHQVLNAIQHDREAEIIQHAGQPGQVTIATNMAGRGVDIKVPKDVLARGGLHVIVAEPNDSARVDRQLMGRCGRQGNPGCVHVFTSMDDTLFTRQLGSLERGLLATLIQLAGRIPDPMIRWVIKRCQHRFEKRAYVSRKNLLDNEEWLDSALPFNRAES